MKTILFDNIIYSLQQIGGISSMWAMLQEIVMRESSISPIFIERNDALNNVYRKSIDIPNNKLIKSRIQIPIILDRYLSIDTSTIMPMVVHSSYYRCVKNKNVKKIVTVHDFTYERYLSGLQRYVHCKQKYRAINDADIVVCVSQNTYNDLFKYMPYIDQNKIQVIYNGVSDDFCKLDDVQRGDRLLYVGSRAKYKNFDLLIEALSETTHHLDICGAPLSIKEQGYLNKKLGRNRYKIYSTVDNNTLNILYNKAKCLIYPSSYEGFGMPIVEAQRSGCPVIAMNVSSIPEIIGETPLLIHNIDKRNLLIKLKLLDTPTLIDEVKISGLENSYRFRSYKMVNDYMELYQN